MSLQEIIEPVRKWDAAGQRSVIALLFKTEGSSPRPPGSRLAINERGDMAGYISLGCVEGDVREHVHQVLAGGPARRVHYGMVDEASLAVGLSCGGQIEVLLAAHDPSDEAWQALLVRAFRERLALVTRIDPPAAGRHLLIASDGSRHGSLGAAALDDEAARTANEALGIGGTMLRQQGEALYFIEILAPPWQLAIVGATPVAASLCKFASAMGVEVTVIDPRADFADPHLFPGARRIVRQWPEEGLLEAGVERNWSVAVLSHDAKLDVPGLAAALRAGCRYVGLLGGRKTQEQRRKTLAEMGFGPDDVSRLHGPIGLRIGSVTPDEIAVSILAEIVSIHRGDAAAR